MEEPTKEEAVVEEAVVEEAVVEEKPTEDEEELVVDVIEHNGVEYYIQENENPQYAYMIKEDDDIGDKVGKVVDGKVILFGEEVVEGNAVEENAVEEATVEENAVEETTVEEDTEEYVTFKGKYKKMYCCIVGETPQYFYNYDETTKMKGEKVGVIENNKKVYDKK